MNNKSVVELRRLAEKCHPVKDADLLKRCEDEIERRLDAELQESEYKFTTTKCPKCGTESIHLATRKNINCLNCRKSLGGIV